MADAKKDAPPVVAPITIEALPDSPASPAVQPVDGEPVGWGLGVVRDRKARTFRIVKIPFDPNGEYEVVANAKTDSPIVVTRAVMTAFQRLMVELGAIRATRTDELGVAVVAEPEA